ncbi:hypothetical protein ACLK2I_18450 [Escherichia coli]
MGRILKMLGRSEPDLPHTYGKTIVVYGTR